MSSEEVPCEFWVAKIKQLTPKVESWDQTCVADFRDKGLEREFGGLVDCEMRCEAEVGLEPETERELDECVSDCREEVKAAATGSIHYKRSGEVVDSNIPVSCGTFYSETDFESQWDFEKEARLRGKLQKKGCVAEVGWVHGHEFVRGGEVEEEPAACSIHVKGAAKGKCMVDDLLEALAKE